MEFLSGLAGTYTAEGVLNDQEKQKEWEDQTLVSADNNLIRKSTPHRFIPLKNISKVPLFCHWERNSSTLPVSFRTSCVIEGVASVTLIGFDVANLSATNAFLVRFSGKNNISDGMNSYGTEDMTSKDIMLPATAARFTNSLEIARWKDGNGKISDLTITLRNVDGTLATWDSLTMWFEVEKTVWY